MESTATGELFESAEQELVDPLTGEIIERTGDTATTETLPKIGRWIRASDRMLDHLTDPRLDCNCSDCNLARESNKLFELIGHRHDLLEKQRAALLALAEGVLLSTGEKSLHYPGIGRFGFRDCSPSVGTDGWDAMNDEQRLEYQRSNMTFIRKEVRLAPDKKRIKAALEENPNNDRLMGIFTLREGRAKFHFKPE